MTETMTSEVKGPWEVAEIPAGGQLIIRRGELGGWWAQPQQHDPGMASAIANFSSTADLLEWLRLTFNRSR